MTEEQLTMELAVIGAHLAADDWQLYLYLIDKLQAAGLTKATIIASAEAFVATKGELSCLS